MDPLHEAAAPLRQCLDPTTKIKRAQLWELHLMTLGDDDGDDDEGSDDTLASVSSPPGLRQLPYCRQRQP